MNILAVGAHPDDVEVGCGGTLALYKKRGHNVYVLVLTKGEASGNPKIREEECMKSARIIGVDKTFFGRLEDTKITDGIDTITEIEDVINRVKPDILFAHSPGETHQDHRNTGLAAMSAGRNLKKLLLYESPAPSRQFFPQIFVDIESTYNAKAEAILTFASQNSKSKYKHIVDAVEGLAGFRGFQSGVKLAEAFEVWKYILEI